MFGSDTAKLAQQPSQIIERQGQISVHHVHPNTRWAITTACHSTTGALDNLHGRLYSHENCKKSVSSDVHLKLVKCEGFIVTICKLHADQMGHAVHLRAVFLFPGTAFLAMHGCGWIIDLQVTA